jgi:hypothetical protein
MRCPAAASSFRPSVHTRPPPSTRLPFTSFHTSASQLLDGFEAVKSADEPYATDGAVYRRQDVVLLAQSAEAEPEAPLCAVMYVKVALEWRGPPSQRYVDACVRNVAQFWTPALVEVRDVDGQLREGGADAEKPAKLQKQMADGGGGGDANGGASASQAPP